MADVKILPMPYGSNVHCEQRRHSVQMIQRKRLVAVLGVCLCAAPASAAYAQAVQSVKWAWEQISVTDRTPTPTELKFPFRIDGQAAGQVVAVPVPELSSRDFNLFIRKGDVETRVSGSDNHRLERLGFVQLRPGTDQLVLVLFLPMNRGARDRKILVVDPATGTPIWQRLQYYHRTGDPVITTSANFNAPEQASARAVVESLFGLLQGE